MTVTAVATSTTSKKSKRREPLLAVDMAATQAQARPAAPGRSGKRRSTRLSLNQVEKNEETNGNRIANASVMEKKRKIVFDEDVEGFQFSRITTKKAKPSAKAPSPVLEEPAPQPSPRRGRPPKKKVEKEFVQPEPETVVVEQKKKKSAGRPSKKNPRGAAKAATEPAPAPAESEPQPEPEPEPQQQQQQEPQPQPERATRSTRKRDQAEPVPLEKKRRKGRPSNSKMEAQAPQQRQPEPEPEPSRNGHVSPERRGTTIALPLADTPVIQRNREMRGKKSVKGNNRRSSLGMRGRRASSLIDSGASNALPHKKVDTADFYKHIAADLPEPRRMRQLLIWCGTRAIGDKPSGSRSEDESARLAARVIQEELLKEFSSNSELSDWFSREDVNPPTLVVKKENPKNVLNAEKIKELEEHIQKLQKERHALNALLRPVEIPPLKPSPPQTEPDSNQPSQPSSRPDQIDLSLLEPSQRRLYAQLDPAAAKHPPDAEAMDTEPSAPETTAAILPQMTPSAISTRLSRITSSLAPTLDSLAAGIHDIDLYRAMSDTVSSRVLRICAERLDERDARNGIRHLALETTDRKDLSLRPRPREDLGLILGALSRVERRS
ncbi:hypothetical protein BO70DRAFT_196020 [Aspergillus heteromorphus CBS 117.55]|uniref:Mis12-Mtw1 protein n=1 Tax=Aspergillus heteromorphus CBS 117.55 TaxID=1448321 RepID=A0A317WRG3_9EURO|nr:uncharacterized protein BO70DRAFT_196020 [Aspergillus heteromorphus CBS 117.55]PWY87518.1 hypothetical protein BO70DRAFT_196020 [Aspergillus heteromorphus CBS 117.55]